MTDIPNSELKKKLLERINMMKQEVKLTYLNITDPYVKDKEELADLLRLTADRIPEDVEVVVWATDTSISGAEQQLLRIAQKFGYERVWVAPESFDQGKWFAERKHPTKEGMIQAVPIDNLIAAKPEDK